MDVMNVSGFNLSMQTLRSAIVVAVGGEIFTTTGFIGMYRERELKLLYACVCGSPPVQNTFLKIEVA
jgi:hypothetical protein